MLDCMPTWGCTVAYPLLLTPTLLVPPFLQLRHPDAVASTRRLHIPFSTNLAHIGHFVAKGSYALGTARKGDVFHVLASLQAKCDGKTWPMEQQQEVLLFMELVKDVTGECMQVMAI